jgi:hypothetical protein
VTRLTAAQLRALNQAVLAAVLAFYEDVAAPLHLEVIIDRLAELFPGARISADEAVSSVRKEKPRLTVFTGVAGMGRMNLFRISKFEVFF